MRATARLLPGRAPRLHLQDGPIDLILLAEAAPDAVAAAYQAATRAFATVLDELCAELPLLRAPVTPSAPWPEGVIARRMRAAVTPLARFGFVTPMAAVAGAVAEAVLASMLDAAPLDRACVNNGGDVALHLGPGRSLVVGMVSRPELRRDGPDLFGKLVIAEPDPARGVATSGRHGRSFSRGIADAVTVLARTASGADAAATVIANAVDLPGHPGVSRRPAAAIQADSDLGDILVTRDVAPLSDREIDDALGRGRRVAETLVASGEIVGAALHLQGRATATTLTRTLQLEDAHG